MTLNISKPVKTLVNGEIRFSSNISVGKESFEVWFQSAHFKDTDDISAATAFLICSLPVAMRTSSDIKSVSPVVQDLVKQSAQIQNILSSWFPEFQKIEIRSDLLQQKAKRSIKKASTFSGGVDSFHTLLKKQKDINYLINVRGFDIELNDEDIYNKVIASIERTATHYEKELIQVSSNLRDFSDKYVDWGYHYHGAALAAVAHLLSGVIGTMYIPSTYHYRDLFPWGSHPLLDPLWNTETIELIHESAENSRFEKVEVITHDQFALDNLTVCWQRINMDEDSRNCSHCEKCLRTMIAIESLGHLQNQKSFDTNINTDLMKKLAITNDHDLVFANENHAHINALENTNESTIEINKILEQSITDYSTNQLASKLTGEPEEIRKLLANTQAGDLLIKSAWDYQPKKVIKAGIKKIFKR